VGLEILILCRSLTKDVGACVTFEMELLRSSKYTPRVLMCVGVNEEGATRDSHVPVVHVSFGARKRRALLHHSQPAGFWR